MKKENKKILYLDDIYNNLEVFSLLLEEEYCIYIAETGDEAREILKNNDDIKVVISDLMMPEESGFEFFKSISTDYPDVIKIIFTAYASVENTIESINEIGVYRYLTKPFKILEIKTAVDQAIERYDLKTANVRLTNELLFANKRWETLIDSLPDSLSIIDREGEILFINHLLFDNQDVVPAVGSNIFNLIQKEYKREHKKLLKTVFSTGKPQIAEMAFNHIPNETKWAEIRYVPLYEENIVSSIMIIVTDITIKKNTSKKILRAILETENNEREHIAGKIHDMLGASLSSIKMYINTMSHEKLHDDKRIEYLHKVCDMVDIAIFSTQEISKGLKPHLLSNFGLIPSIREVCDNINNLGRHNILFDTEPEEFNLDDVIEMIIFQSVNELINNAIKHSGAENIYIKLKQKPLKLEMEYSDDGCGFDIDSALSRTNLGLGLKGIINRIKSVHGTCQIESEIGEGTKLFLKLPLDP